MTGEGAYAYAYDARNRLVSAGGSSYAYDALGRRVLKTTTGVNRYYAHDEQRKVIGEYDGAGSLGETVWLGLDADRSPQGGADLLDRRRPDRCAESRARCERSDRVALAV